MWIHGVDFSGADGGGLAKIRVVGRDLSRPRDPIHFEGRFDRAGLLWRILSTEGSPDTSHIWRIDAPFGLPLETLKAHGLATEGADAWLDAARWMAGFGSPRAWRSAIRAVSRREPKRACDHCFRTPMAPMNLRVFKQTWMLVCDILLPLAQQGVRIEPLCRGGESKPSATVVCEGCPASVLNVMGLQTRGYKGGGEPPRQRRAQVVRALAETGLSIPVAMEGEAVADEEGDLLDAMLLVTGPLQWVPPSEALVEGWVY